MFYKSEIDMQIYGKCMESMKRLNREYYEIRKSKNYKIGMLVSVTMDSLRKVDIRNIKKNYSRWLLGKKSAKRQKSQEHDAPLLAQKPEIYFSNERIAIYTVVFGAYDNILEPNYCPDNIDYYIITDQEFDLSHSVWKKIDISAFSDKLKNLSNAEKNRFFKMFPFDVFKEYNYSIYIDGNIKVITDLTEFVNLIGSHDIATHQHFCRDCVYEECDAVVVAKKDNKENIERHRKLFEQTKMPEHYGLMECNVIARHHTEKCREIMQRWWIEFINYSRRDQLSLPHVLFEFGIPVAEVTTLGANVFLNPALRVVIHN